MMMTIRNWNTGKLLLQSCILLQILAAATESNQSSSRRNCRALDDNWRGRFRFWALVGTSAGSCNQNFHLNSCLLPSARSREDDAHIRIITGCEQSTIKQTNPISELDLKLARTFWVHPARSSLETKMESRCNRRLRTSRVILLDELVLQAIINYHTCKNFSFRGSVGSGGELQLVHQRGDCRENALAAYLHWESQSREKTVLSDRSCTLMELVQGVRGCIQCKIANDCSFEQNWDEFRVPGTWIGELAGLENGVKNGCKFLTMIRICPTSMKQLRASIIIAVNVARVPHQRPGQPSPKLATVRTKTQSQILETKSKLSWSSAWDSKNLTKTETCPCKTKIQSAAGFLCKPNSVDWRCCVHQIQELAARLDSPLEFRNWNVFCLIIIM